MSKSTYLLYLGCAIPARVLSYEISARRIAKSLDIKLIEMTEFSCCGLPLDPINHDMMLVLAAQNLCLAEQQGLNIMTLCPGCNGTLCKVNKMLKEDDGLKKRVNGYLNKVGMEFRGEISVKHFIEVLNEDVGLKKIKNHVQKPLKGLKTAAHYGCHLLRPTEYIDIDDPENPTILKKFIEVTGAKYLGYANEMECCGAAIIISRSRALTSELLGKDDIPLQLTRDKLAHLREAGAHVLVTLCPSCYRMYDVNQPMIERIFNESFKIPVLHYPELLALAMGVNSNDLALNEHRVNTSEILDFLNSHER